MTQKYNPKVTVQWQPIKAEPPPAWRRLVEKLLRGRGKNLPTGDDCKTTGGDEGEKGESL